MTLKELKLRHESKTKQPKSVKAKIKAQVYRKCLQRGCNESLAFRSKAKVICVIIRVRSVNTPARENTSITGGVSLYKAEQRRLNRGTYIARFGTLNNARIEAGLNAVIPMPFGQIVELTPDQYREYKAGHVPQKERKHRRVFNK